VGGLLTNYFGWRSIFLALVPLGIISLLLIAWKMKGEWAESRGDKFDWKGSVIYGLSLLFLMYGFSKLPRVQGFIMVASGITVFITFLLFERKTENPVLRISIITENKVFAYSSLAALIHYAATSAIGFFMSLYLQYLKGIDAGKAGLVMIVQPVTMALLSSFAGRLSDKYNPGVIASSGMALTALAITLMCFISAATPMYIIIILLFMIGLGFAFFSSPNTNAVMSSVEKKHLGLASGIVGTMRMIGQMMSMGISMLLFALFLGKEVINPMNYKDFLSSMKTGLVISALLCIFGVFASLARTPVNNKIKKDEYSF